MKKLGIFFLILPFLFSACAPAQSSSSNTPDNLMLSTLTATPDSTSPAPIIVSPTRTKSPTRTPLAPVSLDQLRAGQYAFIFQSESGVTLQYWLYLPEKFDPNKEWPLILFLHGSGERGMTIERVKSQGLPEMLETDLDIPFIVVSPQLDSGYWDKRIDAMNELLSYLQETLPVASDQVYLTGISLGGFGTWSYALQYPDRFAAIAPIAGGYDEQAPHNICKLKDLPIWAFHGDADTQVDPFYDQILVDALLACGGDPKFTLYPDTSHISTWDKAYADPALYEWFLEHKK